MSERTPDLNEQLDRIEGLCPALLARPLHFIREPRLKWLRLTVGVLSVIGGLLSFLPILGIELLPLGLMLIAIDVPVLRKPVAIMIDWIWRLVVRVLTVWQVLAVKARAPQRGLRHRRLQLWKRDRA